MLDIIKMSKEHPGITVSVTVSDLMSANARLLANAKTELFKAVKDEVGEVLLTKEVVMAKLAVSDSTLWRWKKSGYLVPVNVGGQSRYRSSDILSIMDGKR